jgi:hypothetical protein
VKGTAKMKPVKITKECEGTISEMEKLLTMWMEAQIQRYVPLNLMIQAKAGNLFQDLKKSRP